MFKEAAMKKIKADLGDTFEEMEREGGSVIMDLENGKIRFENCSADVIEKIKAKIH